MSFKNIPTGKDVPNDLNVVIEISSNSPPVKYELDKESGALFVDRFMSTAMFYPCNYGYIPQTLAEDDDPIDVLVVTPISLIAGSVIRVRPVGMMKMTDESGPDVKVLAVPVSKLTKEYEKIKSQHDFSEGFIKNIEHFFTHYKDNEPNKWVRVEGWVDLEATKKEILLSIDRYKIAAN